MEVARPEWKEERDSEKQRRKQAFPAERMERAEASEWGFSVAIRGGGPVACRLRQSLLLGW